MSKKYYRYGHIDGLKVKVGDKVKKGQQIAKNGTGNGQWYAHCHFDIFRERPASFTEFCVGKSKEWVKSHYANPRGLEKIVMPTYHHLGYGWLEDAQYSGGHAYHPGLDLNGAGSGNADLNDPINSATDGEVVYIYNGTGKNGGWGKLIVIKEIEEIKEVVEKIPEVKEEVKEPEKKEDIAPVIEEPKKEPEKITEDEELANNCQAIVIDLKFLVDKFLALFNKFFNKKNMYKITTPRETYEIEAKNKKDCRKLICEKEEITIEKVDKEDYDPTLYYQRSFRYKGWKLGNSNTSMQNYGCALMCWSLVARKDPKDVDQLFIDKGVYNGDMIDFKKVSEVLGFKNYEKSTDINRMPTQEETIKEVYLGKSQHFTVRFNKDGKRWIFDPWTGAEQPINKYTFKSYRIFNK